MVIQRWQSAMLLLAGILLGVSMFTPVAVVSGEFPQIITPLNSVVTIILGTLTTILSFIVIFLYKNLRQQIKTTYLCAILTLAYAATCYIMPCSMADAVECKVTGGLCMVVAALWQVLAAARMRADENKLKSYDRIR